MTERAPRLAHRHLDQVPITSLSEGSIPPGGSLSLTFSDSIVLVSLDQTGDWTITAGLSTASNRLPLLTRTLEGLGFFHAAEQAGVVYHLWTSALQDRYFNRESVEEILLQLVESFQSIVSPNYIS